VRRGIGWVDAHLLASAIEARAQLYTADAALQAVAREFGIAHPA
jgi:predicted nucleic acid-binding protein